MGASTITRRNTPSVCPGVAAKLKINVRILYRRTEKNRFDSPFSPFRACRSAPGALLQRVSSGFVPRFVRFGAAPGQGGAAFREHGLGAAAFRLRLFRERRVGPGYPVPAFGCGVGRGSPLRRSGRGVSVAGFRVRGCFGCGVGRRVPGPRLFRLRRWSGLSIEALRSRRVGRRVPGPQRSGYSFSVWGSSLTETSRVLFSRSACGRGLLVHSSQSRRRCVMSMAA